MKKFIAFVACALVLSGCSSKDDTAEAYVKLVSGDFVPGETLVVEYGAGEYDLTGSTAWIGVVPSDVEKGPEGPADMVDAAYVHLSDVEGNQVELVLPEDLSEGNYDIRLYSSDDELNGVLIGFSGSSYSYGDVEPEEDKMEEEDSSDANSSDVDSDLAACLIGDWKITNFSDYVVAIVNKNGGLGNVSSTDSGELVLSFDGEVMSMSDNNFQVSMSVLGINTPVNIEAVGSTGYEVDGNLLKGKQADASIADTNTGYSFGFSNFAAGDVEFECAGDNMTWKQNGNFPIDLEYARL